MANDAERAKSQHASRPARTGCQVRTSLRSFALCRTRASFFILAVMLCRLGCPSWSLAYEMLFKDGLSLSLNLFGSLSIQHPESLG
jgi:hypothetical protein